MLCKSSHGARAAPTRQDEILAAAAELFLAEGYGATSINRLIERVSGSKATIYAMFGNKERLFAAVVESILDGTESFVTADVVKGLDLREGLIAIGGKLIDTATSPRHVSLARLVIAESPRFPELGRIFFDRTSARFTRHIARYIAEHTQPVAALRPTELAEMFAGMLLHHLLFERFCGAPSSLSPARLRRLTEQASELIATSLAGSAARNLDRWSE